MNISKFIIYEKEIKSKEAQYSKFPNEMKKQLIDFLRHSNIEKLYSHQAKMFELASKNKNIVITTPTASGKTLSFLLPIIQEVLQNPLTRAIFIYPTKALTSDQYRAIKKVEEFFGPNRISIGIYDGDTPVNMRSRVRNNANIILTNPEMLNMAFMPNHNQYGFENVFSNLKYIVVDELHTYRGAFGSHMANIFKRLSRINKYYSCKTQYFCSSATIANPLELAKGVCGEKFSIINEDGSPAPKKKYYFIQPPYIKGTNLKESITRIATDLIPQITIENKRFIAFCKSRKSVEIILKESRDKLRYDGLNGDLYYDHFISGYRGGYTQNERKEIEDKMTSGSLRGVISTNALELGIDIGDIDTAVLVGYPSTRASFWQQSGRAGRMEKTSSTYLVLDNLPFDQFIAVNPDWIFDNSSENAVLDPNNLFIQLAHVRAASAELPLSLDDTALFPNLGEIIPILLKAKEIHELNGKFFWNGNGFPAGDYSLRNIDKSRYQLISKKTGKIISEMDETQAFQEIYEGAIYIHDGLSYYVENLDLDTRKAYAILSNENYYTSPHRSTNVAVIKELKNKELGRTKCYQGDVHVKNTIVGFKKIQFHSHQNLGYQELEEDLVKEFETEGLWIKIPQNVTEIFRVSNINLNGSSLNYFHGLMHSIKTSALMITMTTTNDIGSSLIRNGKDDSEMDAICLYDMFLGGLGYAKKAYNHIDKIIKNATRSVRECSCKSGCPACTGDYYLDKELIIWGLESLFEIVKPPKDFSIKEKQSRLKINKPFNLNTLEDSWNDYIKLAKAEGGYLSMFLTTIEGIKVIGDNITLFVKEDFNEIWANSDINKEMIKNTIGQHVELLDSTNIMFRSIGEKDSKRDELLRRLNHIKRSDK